MTILTIIILILLLYLVSERIVLNRQIRSIPLRIAVTGSRGKSGIVRMLASVLRENDMRVVAKTTGSQARLIQPDGREIPIHRRGMTSILEQKKLLRYAVRQKANCMIAEIMSIHPENQYVESRQILCPNMILITNLRCDHVDAMGDTREQIAATLCLGIPNDSKIFIPQNENLPVVVQAAKKRNAELIETQNNSVSMLNLDPNILQNKFTENIDLVYTVANHLNLKSQTIAQGINKGQYDIGELKTWRYSAGEAAKTIYFVNAFAANDPQSTFQVIQKIQTVFPSLSKKFIGLLNLRTDRGDRTLQWIKALQDNGSHYFKTIFVTGGHSHAVKRKIKFAHPVNNKSVEKVMDSVLSLAADHDVIFGFGNVAGMGEKFIEYWNQIGIEYGH